MKEMTTDEIKHMNATEKARKSLEYLREQAPPIDPYWFWRQMGADDETIAEHLVGIEQDRQAFALWFGRLSEEQHAALEADMEEIQDWAIDANPVAPEEAVYRCHGYRAPYGWPAPKLGKAASDRFVQLAEKTAGILETAVVREMTTEPEDRLRFGED